MGRLTSRETAIVLEEKTKSLEAQGITPHTRELEYIALAKYENAIEDGELLPVKRGESDKDTDSDEEAIEKALSEAPNEMSAEIVEIHYLTDE